jgi:hypothetical protein
MRLEKSLEGLLIRLLNNFEHKKSHKRNFGGALNRECPKKSYAFKWKKEKKEES